MNVRRGSLRDVYVGSGRAAVMADEQVIILSEVATSILQAVPAHGSVDLTRITASVIQAVGTPEWPLDAETLIRQQVLDLAAHHVLIVDRAVPLASEAAAHSAASLRAVHDAMRSALGPDASFRWELPAGVSYGAFLSTVERQRVGCQLATRMETVDLPDTVAAGLRAHHADQAAESKGLARDLHQVLELLAAAGVRTLVFKGLALAAQAWDDSTARGYGDLDLLVSPDDLVRAHDALCGSGWRTSYVYPTPSPSWGWRHFVRTEHEMAFGRGRTAVDLHWHALAARGSLPGFDELWARRDEVAICGQRVPTFGPFDALAHSASHSATDHWRWLRGLADVHRLMSEPRTWAGANRPLRGDQLLTIGIAARLFGIPDNSPQVVSDATGKCRSVMPRVQRAQLRPERGSVHDWVPGLGSVRMMVPLWHSRARPREFGRRMSSSVLPAWALAQEPSPHGHVAAPRVALLRSVEIARRLRSRRSSLSKRWWR